MTPTGVTKSLCLLVRMIKILNGCSNYVMTFLNFSKSYQKSLNHCMITYNGSLG